MNEFNIAFVVALELITRFDPDLVEIVLLSLQISLSAVVLATLVSLPIGAALAVFRFRGRGAVIVLLNALMGLPPVVVGLILYLLLSRAGPLGEHGLLYTPAAMTIAQCVLVIPIIAALAQQTMADLYEEYSEQLRSLGVSSTRAIPTLLRDGCFSLLIAVLAGFGRASAEVGAVIMVGGNINHMTRTMTTTIAMETSKGNLELALGLGLILILVIVVVNGLTLAVRSVAVQKQGGR